MTVWEWEYGCVGMEVWLYGNGSIAVWEWEYGRMGTGVWLYGNRTGEGVYIILYIHVYLENLLELSSEFGHLVESLLLETFPSAPLV